jgi:hypothetical protein
MLGISLINILQILDSDVIENKDLLIPLLEIISMCCIIFYKIGQRHYITEYTIDEIKTKYDLLCNKINQEAIKKIISLYYEKIKENKKNNTA